MPLSGSGNLLRRMLSANRSTITVSQAAVELRVGDRWPQYGDTPKGCRIPYRKVETSFRFEHRGSELQGSSTH